MARQTTQFREEARDIIKKCIRATDKDALIFTGSGATAAVNKLVNVMDLHGQRGKQTVIFVGPYEHHSNILPWKETGAKVVRIRDTNNGYVDTQHLEQELKKYRKRKDTLIGCFSAASNVTGIITDTNKITALLHKYGALAFWDYATAGPYVRIEMNTDEIIDGVGCSKDAIYLSPHKFVGGVGTPGLLVAKKSVFINEVPSQTGGGTVLYVTRESHHYVKNIEEREEGGTPAIVESIRAGLAFKLKNALGSELIERREHELTRIAFQRWQRNPNIIILGSKQAVRLPIFSFLIIHSQTGKLLHHNFIAALLNDIYGIQARGGCACAGPYAQDLLGINEELAKKFIHFLVEEKEIITHDYYIPKLGGYKHRKRIQKRSLEIMKPGFVRLNLPYFVNDDVIEYILEAVDQIATHGWKLLPQYSPDLFTANWRHLGKRKSLPSTIEQDSLHSTSFSEGQFYAPPSPFATRKNHSVDNENILKTSLKEAGKIFQNATNRTKYTREHLRDKIAPHVEEDNLVWFLRPHEAAYCLRMPTSIPPNALIMSEHTLNVPVMPPLQSQSNALPFSPRRYGVWPDMSGRSESIASRLSVRSLPTNNKNVIKPDTGPRSASFLSVINKNNSKNYRYQQCVVL